MSTISPASFLGIQSLPAAVVFTSLYAPLTLLFSWRAVSRFNFVHIFITIFCLVRIAAFAIRAVLAGSGSAAQSLDLLVADLILFGVGFTGLLFSTFSLQADRERVAGLHYRNFVLVFLTSKKLFLLVNAAAVALSIAGTTKSFSDSAAQRDLGSTQRQVGMWLIFVLTAAQLLRAAVFIHFQVSRIKNVASSFVDKHAGSILGVISALLLVRMIYNVITVSKPQHEASWYPLSTLPEFLCVCLFAVPGLVPSRAELREKDIELEGYRNRPVVVPSVV